MTLNRIIPIPSAKLSVVFNGIIFPITLDSGSTVSFMSLELVKSLMLSIQPNGQLAQLALPHIKAKSLGEVDFVGVESTTGYVNLRVRALVMSALSVPCYGGRTFERDNHIIDDVTTSKVSLHGGRFIINLGPVTLPLAHPPPQLTTQPLQNHAPKASALSPTAIQPETSSVTPSSCSPSPTCQPNPVMPSTLQTPSPSTVSPILMKKPANLLPGGVYPIPCNLPPGGKVLVLPPTPLEPPPGSSLWPAQVCDIASGSALYVNCSDQPLCHEKNTHFRLLPMHEEPVISPRSCAVDLLAIKTTPQQSATAILSQIKINQLLLTPAQLDRIDSLHRRHITAFNEDMSGGFHDPVNPYFATFAFRGENMTPPYKVWSPSFNRKNQDLLQAKCDDLEREGIMADPSKHGIDVRLVSPSFIQQKGRAKHKTLEQCSMDELRFITCFNTLNDSIHPIPGRSFVYNDIIKFLSRKKFTIFADLASSYFQVKVDKKFWKYMGVLTPFRGIRVLTRLGQGLLNSDVHLEQVVTRVLGDEMTADKCIMARDDLIVGGNSIDECLANWASILPKLDSHNLKLAPTKVRLFLQDAEIYGHRIRDGKIRPSDHIVSSLAATTTESLTTVKQVNSWKGLYKTLIRHLPNLSSLMAPFDAACAGQPSAGLFDWSKPGILAAFNAATKHLDKVMETYLPDPEEQLALMPDTSDINLCTGWVLYTERESDEGPKWLPVQYASAKLAPYMATWTPCEKEGVGTVLSIDQVRHWINESSKPTLVLPDNKPVVEAANLMRMGRHSKNPRLQSFLACVNRSNVVFRHNSAKAGLHTVPDALSRAPVKPCTSADCQVHRFLSELPAKVECMPISLESIALASSDPAILAATASDMGQLLGKGTGPIPLGARATWISLQADCEDCVQFLLCKRLGQMPGRRDRNRATINRMLKLCEVVNGLIVSKTFDSTLMKETVRVFVPSVFLEAILTVMHVRLDHPVPSQLQRLFERYFLGFNVQKLCVAISDGCSLCVANKRFPRELDTFSPSPGPLHPGSHMNLDLMRRASQYVVVNVDRFSNLTTATLVADETRETLAAAILTVVTPIRHAAQVEVRTDRATALQSLANRPHPQLEENGIKVILGEHGNRNSNCSVDKTIRDLEEELKKIDPGGRRLTPGELCRAVTNLNNRVRTHGLSASQLHFSRDQHTGENLDLRDTTFQQIRGSRQEKHNPIAAKSKAPLRAHPHQSSNLRPGQITHIRGEGTKHTSRDSVLVTKVEGRKATVQKLLRSTQGHSGAPKITSPKLLIDERFLAPPLPSKTRSGKTHQPSRSSISKDWRADMFSAAKPAVHLRPEWQPVPLPDDHYLDEDEAPAQWDPEHHQPPLTHIEVDANADRVQHEPEEGGEVGGGADDEAERAEAGGGAVEEQEENEGEAEGGQQHVDPPEIDGGQLDDQQEDVAEDHIEGDWGEEGVDAPPVPNIQPEDFDHPPWPPLPRQRLLGIGGPPAVRRRKRASPQAVRPPLDLEGRLVSVGEAIKFTLPEGQGGDRREGVMSATVLHTAKTVQRRYPTSYNIRTQDRIDMSIELTATPGWWVFRRGRWYPGNHPHPPPPDVYPEEDEVADEGADQEGDASRDEGAAGGALH